jgi:hypothetical protein
MKFSLEKKAEKLQLEKFLPEHGLIYLAVVVIDGEAHYYAGQTENGQKRIISNHRSVSYRKSHPKFLYLLMDKAERTVFLLPVVDPKLVNGPIMNILEQWIALIFRALQPVDLRGNLDLHTQKWISRDELGKGINIREPLAQGFGFNEWHMSSNSFKYSLDSLKREWYNVSRNREITPRRESFLRGDLFEGSFWKAPGWYGKADYEFQIWSVKLRIGRSHIDRLYEETIRVTCELSEPGTRHPNSAAWAAERYEDPALRLAIKISGTRKGDICKGDQTEGFVWVKMDGDLEKGTCRLNRLVDWLEDLDTEELRPRRWYPANANLAREYCGYTKHPLDVGDAWSCLTKD